MHYGLLFTKFTVLRTMPVTTDMGRVLRNAPEEIGNFSAILSGASSKEKERWGQLSYIVTHKIIVEGVLPFSLQTGDIFRFSEKDGKEREILLTSIPYDVGNLGHYTLLVCGERRDL